MTLKIPLENQWANINQTWHKASLGKGIQIYLNEGPIPFPKGDNNVSGTTGLVSTKFVTSKDHSSLHTNERPCPIPRDISDIVCNTLITFKDLSHWANDSTKLGIYHLWVKMTNEDPTFSQKRRSWILVFLIFFFCQRYGILLAETFFRGVKWSLNCLISH